MAHKVCPICGALAHEQAVECGVCGAELSSAEVVRQIDDRRQVQQGYDFHYGETDLAENQIRWRGGTYFLAGVLALATVICVGSLFVGATRFLSNFSSLSQSDVPPIASSMPSGTTNSLVLATNTAQPSLVFSTVTNAPPTRTPLPTEAPTETPGPCIQRVQAGDSLIGLVSRCGHRDLDVIDLVLKLNHLESPELIQVGQTLEIPWPTPTVDPNATSTGVPPQVGEISSGQTETVALANPQSNFPDPLVHPTETLQPGVMWHTITKGENIISVAVQYGANAKILSELNPEVTFSQCDFGKFGGGPSCVVMLYEGQRIRVPAPTPTPTLSPTPSGSETPTPTATPTFNAPSALSPGDRALFQGQELVTLRWVASGTLGPGQVYRVTVRDLTDNVVYTDDTTELFYILPEAWQGRDSRHEYQWTVSVVDANSGQTSQFTTEPRNFSWEGRNG